MKFFTHWSTYFLIPILLTHISFYASEASLPEEMQKIMQQEKYEHSIWGIYVKDLQTGKVLFDLNSEKLFSPASTTKLFSVAALLQVFGDDYRFKTPVYYSGKIESGLLKGSLILVAQGDLTMGGRQDKTDKISFTKLDHIIANEVPGVLLTKEDPLNGLNNLALQIFQKGIKEIDGDIVIDESLFDATEKRGMILTPIMINENLIDIVINPSEIGQQANLTWRPQVPGYVVDNQVKTVAKEGGIDIKVSSDEIGHHITIQGTIPLNQHNVVRTFSIKDPKVFARAAFIQSLEKIGIKVNLPLEDNSQNQTLSSFKDTQRVALLTSAPLSEYAKLILKVSHNLGANLIPLLLASRQGKHTFDEGMRLLGDFAIQKVNTSPNAFVFIDGAGGNENRLTPQAEVKLLEFMYKQSPSTFQNYFDALPILGVDGSLEDFAKGAEGVGKIRAKTGTGAALNLATDKLFLITQALAGYIEGKNKHLFAYVVVVNNAAMPTIDDIFAIFEDEGQISSMIYKHTERI